MPCSLSLHLFLFRNACRQAPARLASTLFSLAPYTVCLSFKQGILPIFAPPGRFPPLLSRHLPISKLWVHYALSAFSTLYRDLLHDLNRSQYSRASSLSFGDQCPTGGFGGWFLEGFLCGGFCFFFNMGIRVASKHHFASTIAHLTNTTYLLYCTGGRIRVKASRLVQQARTTTFTDLCPNRRALSFLPSLLCL